MATILAPKLERRFLVPVSDAESGPPLPGLFSRLYMAPEILEERTTFRAAVLSPLKPLIPPGRGTSTELLSIMVLLDWRADGLGGEKGPESLAWQKRQERTESQVIVKVQIGEKSSNKRTSWRAVCLIKHSGKACLTAAAAAPRGWRTPSFDFNHSLVLHTYCRGSKNEFLHHKRHSEKVKSSKKSFSSSTVLKTEKTKNTKVSGRGQCRWQHTVQVR